MQRSYLIGAGVRSDDPATFLALAGMCCERAIDHIQVMIIPEKEQAFREHLDIIAEAGVPVVIHAPHHGQGVNPCAPAAFESRPVSVMKNLIARGMAQTLEAADLLCPQSIVLHAGRYEDGRKADAERTLLEFLDEYHDPRIIMENMPEVYREYHLLGSTAEELERISGGMVDGFCLDFAHLYCTTNYLSLDYAETLKGFDSLNIRLHHLSNNTRGSITDQHLPLDHPEGGMDFRTIIAWIRAHPGVQTSLEYKENNAEIYVEQLKVFDGLYRKFLS